MSEAKRVSEMTINELRSMAKSIGIDYGKDWTKENLQRAIGERRKQKTVARLVDDTTTPIPEGYARIKIQRGQGYNGPIEVCVNFFRCIIPRDVIVDVPIEVVRESLDHSEDHEYRLEKTETGEEVTKQYPRQTYQYQMYGMNDTGKSVIKGIGSVEDQALRERYRSRFGRYPRRLEYQALVREHRQRMWEKENSDADDIDSIISKKPTKE